MKRLVTKAALVAALMCGVSGAAFAEGKIVISNWDGYMPKELLENFKKDLHMPKPTGVGVTLTAKADS